MTAVTNFVRKTPAASLQTYFKRTGIQLMPAVDWDAPEADVVRPLLQAVEDLDDSAAARVVNDAERVTAMADETGQAAIYSVVQTPDRLDELRNDHDRALWMFLHDATGFRHAEEVQRGCSASQCFGALGHTRTNSARLWRAECPASGRAWRGVRRGSN
jgi:hypothetical protein